MWRRLYDGVVRAAGHRHALWWLGALSFAEASFFPIPPDAMLVPMTLARRSRWLIHALVASLGSALGGLLGYAIGVFFLDALLPWLHHLGYGEGYDLAREWFAAYGFWAILVAGFSPIPYKVFTIAAGAVGMLLLPFALASVAGRGARFLVVAGLVRWLGPVFEQNLLKYIDWIGWATVALIVIAFAAYRLS